jgi:hypothetical protein
VFVCEHPFAQVDNGRDVDQLCRFVPIRLLCLDLAALIASQRAGPKVAPM